MNPEKKVLILPEVMARVRLSRSSIYRLMDRGLFPKSFKLGLAKNGWFIADIEKWLADRRGVAA